jgi:pyruvate/2-oxoglutarate dehydrogenase complex dihydrolipoamide acyltransferase (E2) component
VKVEILEHLSYSDFSTERITAKALDVGTVVNFPDWYANSLIKSGHAQPATDEQPFEQKTVVREMTSDFITVSAKKLADENNIDPWRIKGTGVNGRITKKDVSQWLMSH